MRLSLPVALAALVLVPVLSSCGGSSGRSDAAPAAAGNSTVIVPTITPKAETPLAQQQHDTSATLSLEPAKLTVTQKRDERSASGIGSSVGGKYRYTVTTTDVAEFEPERLQLLVAFKNLGKEPMDYDDGIQVEYLLNGKAADFSKSTEGVSMGNVPAGGTAFLRLSGPKIDTLKVGDQGVITLHNVNVKGAGKSSHRANLTWQFTVAAEKTVELKTVETTEWR